MTIMPMDGGMGGRPMPWDRQAMPNPLKPRRKGLFGSSAGYNPAGQVIPGNLPTGITQRVSNPDGSVSTVRTMSFGTDEGEVLVPTVLNGRVVSNDEAINNYRNTGQSFGVFKTPEDATAYAQTLHKQHEAALSSGGGASPTSSTEQPLAQKKGFDWGKLIGVLGDSLSIAGGGQASYVPMMQQQRLRRDAQDYAEQTYQRRRGDELQDFGARQEIEAQYRPAPQPHRWESNDGSLMELGPDGQPRVAYKDPTPKINWVRADNGDGTFTMVPMGPNGPINLGGQGGPSGAPAAPKGKLTPYGGGQTATPSGNFR